MKVPKATDVHGVLHGLESLAWDAAEADNPNALFFALYAQVTRQIKRGIDEKRFRNSQLMEAVDVYFGNILFDQVRASQASTSHSPSIDQVDQTSKPESWTFFFNAQRRSDLTAAQHMLLGVGPHILHDLAIAMYKVIPEEDLESFHEDYLQINDFLLQVLEQIQDILATKSFGMRVVDWLLCKADEWVAMSSLALLRDRAFEGTRRLFAKSKEADASIAVAQIEKDLDAEALVFSETIASTPATCILCSVGVLNPDVANITKSILNKEIK